MNPSSIHSKDIYLKIKKKKAGNFPSFDRSIFLRKKMI